VSLPPFERVVEEHGAVVLRVCRALLGPADADDAWSETFLAALRAYPRLRPDSDVRAWLTTIAHRKAVDQLRGAARRALPTGDVADRADGAGRRGPSNGAGVDAVDAVADRDPALWEALAALPFKQRGAIAYHHLAGLPYAEVGPLLGSSEAAARRSAADGLAKLRAATTKETTR
jgi:RNA polymerase sigma factor (sigma-70 family)